MRAECLVHSLPARLFHSLAAATAQPSLHHSAPFLGRTLEIERQSSQRVAIDDPSAPAGKALSRGVHARLLGTRAYVDSRETDSGDPKRAELVIASIVHDEIVATVPLGAVGGIGVVEPCSRRASRAAP